MKKVINNHYQEQYENHFDMCEKNIVEVEFLKDSTGENNKMKIHFSDSVELLLQDNNIYCLNRNHGRLDSKKNFQIQNLSRFFRQSEKTHETSWLNREPKTEYYHRWIAIAIEQA